MKEVKIIAGTYGYVNSMKRVRPVSLGETVWVDDAEADRLETLGIAEIISDIPVETTKSVANSCEDKNSTCYPENLSEGSIEGCLDGDDLSELSMTQLKELASDIGIDTKGIKRKDKLIELISAETVYGTPYDEDACSHHCVGAEDHVL